MKKVKFIVVFKYVLLALMTYVIWGFITLVRIDDVLAHMCITLFMIVIWFVVLSLKVK